VRSIERACFALLIAAALAVPAAAGQQRAVPAHTPEEITRAVETVRKDPNLGGVRMIKLPRWREPQEPSRAASPEWLRGLLAWIMQSSRMAVFVALTVLAAWLAIYVLRAVRSRRATPAADGFVAPTHVRDLDIRPESLPANIGRAARALWDAGDHRAALSLLYRGLLSRLTHVHRVPITDSSTEGDCLQLMAGVVTPATGQYSTRLIGAWRDLVYGGSAQPDDAMHALCNEFAGALDRRARPAGGGAE
jgi:hypothetical protein